MLNSYAARLPDSRGPLSAELLARLTGPPTALPQLAELAQEAAATQDCLRDEDFQLSLTLLYELHYRGWPRVDDRWEWHPDLVAAARSLEATFEAALRRLTADRLPDRVPPDAVPAMLATLVDSDDGPSLSRYLARQASAAQYAEFLAHRSIYHLKEADPHSWAVPRLGGAAKSALVEIQADEYGGGRPEWMHAALFAASMRGLGLVDAYGCYVDAVPAPTLAWANTMTLFGLHRRLRGAVAGHLAALEMTSSLPNKRYGDGLRRLGFDAEVTRFFDEHVEADAVHEQIACHDLAGRLAEAEPGLAADILFGAAAALATDGLVTGHLIECWEAGTSSLRIDSAAAALVGTG
jgi:Iron-containing redox enzyme